MILISNHCNAGFTYKLLDEAYLSPFVWCYTPISSLINLINKWYSVNWANIKMDKCANRQEFVQYGAIKYKLDKTFYMNVDDTGVISYPHYVFDKNAHTPTVCGCDVAYDKICEYIFKKYITRVKKMCSTNEMPVIHYLPISDEEFERTIELIDVAKTVGFRIFIIDGSADFKLKHINTTKSIELYRSDYFMPAPDYTERVTRESVDRFNEWYRGL